MSTRSNTNIIPIMYFIGVSTGQSFVNKIFPQWIEVIGREVELQGVDLPLNANPQQYREVVTTIKNNDLIVGALVTSHKVSLFNAASDIFDDLGNHSSRLNEVSVIYKRGGKLLADVTDLISIKSALDSFIPQTRWTSREIDVCILGCGGAATALAYTLISRDEASLPRKVLMTDVSETRIGALHRFLSEVDKHSILDIRLVASAEESDAIIHSLSPGSLIVNATGIGKDIPGSPLSDKVRFPQYGYIWEFNYRGDLKFVEQAKLQSQSSNLVIEDGWTCFLHGWARVLEKIFDFVDYEDVLKKMSEVAYSQRKDYILSA